MPDYVTEYDKELQKSRSRPETEKQIQMNQARLNCALIAAIIDESGIRDVDAAELDVGYGCKVTFNRLDSPNNTSQIRIDDDAPDAVGGYVFVTDNFIEVEAQKFKQAGCDVSAVTPKLTGAPNPALVISDCPFRNQTQGIELAKKLAGAVNGR